jgi:hypothetical protein
LKLCLDTSEIARPASREPVGLPGGVGAFACGAPVMPVEVPAHDASAMKLR